MLPPVEKETMEAVIHLPQGTGGHAAPVQNEKKRGQRVELRHPPFETGRNWGQRVGSRCSRLKQEETGGSVILHAAPIQNAKKQGAAHAAPV